MILPESKEQDSLLEENWPCCQKVPRGMLIAGKIDGCNLSNFKVSSTHRENARVTKNNCIWAVESLINRPFETRRSLFEDSQGPILPRLSFRVQTTLVQNDKAPKEMVRLHSRLQSTLKFSLKYVAKF